MIAFLENEGIDYRSLPIPERAKLGAMESYPNSWEAYLREY